MPPSIESAFCPTNAPAEPALAPASSIFCSLLLLGSICFVIESLTTVEGVLICFVIKSPTDLNPFPSFLSSVAALVVFSILSCI